MQLGLTARDLGPRVAGGEPDLEPAQLGGPGRDPGLHRRPRAVDQGVERLARVAHPEVDLAPQPALLLDQLGHQLGPHRHHQLAGRGRL